MNAFTYQARRLFVEGVPLASIARQFGTPLYVYSEASVTGRFAELAAAFAGVPHLVCYAVKANSNLALLNRFAAHGAGFDVVSGGELQRVVKAQGEASKVVFSGVGKTPDEMAFALKLGIRMFNVESGEELAALDRVGRECGTRAPFAIRVNPDVDPKTHRYIATGLSSSKFGVPFPEANRLYGLSRRMKGVVAVGVDCHIGSQLTDPRPMRAAMEKVAGFYQLLLGAGFSLGLLDVGGGLGIQYQAEPLVSLEDYAKALLGPVSRLGATLVLEPGRMLVGNAGVLLTRVLYRKRTQAKRFVVVDAAMNDLIRPALYEAEHQIWPVVRRPGSKVKVDVVGPVCESSDFLARDRPLVLPKADDLLAVMSAGAYGMSMASNYNSRPRPAEVLVRGRHFRVIRERESVSSLWRGESV